VRSIYRPTWVLSPVAPWHSEQVSRKRRSRNDLTTRVNRLQDRFATELKDLRQELAAFKEVVNGKFRDLDSEIAKIMDKIK
jgi:hypothetical protein